MRRKSIIVYRGEHCPVPEKKCSECSYLWEGQCCLETELKKQDEEDKQ
jgi:hypothetical protein